VAFKGVFRVDYGLGNVSDSRNVGLGWLCIRCHSAWCGLSTESTVVTCRMSVKNEARDNEEGNFR
jgi:hypothetical protein